MCGVGLNSKVKDKTMITFDEKKYPQITDAEIKDALQFSTEQVIRDLPEFTDQFQNAYSENGFYQRFRIITGPAASGPERSGWLMNIRRTSV